MYGTPGERGELVRQFAVGMSGVDADHRAGSYLILEPLRVLRVEGEHHLRLRWAWQPRER